MGLICLIYIAIQLVSFNLVSETFGENPIVNHFFTFCIVSPFLILLGELWARMIILYFSYYLVEISAEICLKACDT